MSVDSTINSTTLLTTMRRAYLALAPQGLRGPAYFVLSRPLFEQFEQLYTHVFGLVPFASSHGWPEYKGYAVTEDQDAPPDTVYLLVGEPPRSPFATDTQEPI